MVTNALLLAHFNRIYTLSQHLFGCSGKEGCREGLCAQFRVYQDLAAPSIKYRITQSVDANISCDKESVCVVLSEKLVALN